MSLPWTLFHEPWWLDAAAPGGWREVTVEDGGQVVGRLPFVLRRKFGFTAIGMPPLTRTLGPQIVGHDSDDPPLARRRLDIAAELFAKLPPHDYFFQICDPAMRDGLHCQVLGYEESLRHTFRIPAGTPLDECWRLCKGTTRVAVRKAAARLVVDRGLHIEEFCKFYNRAVVENHGGARGDGHDALKHRLYHAALERQAVQLLGAREPDSGDLLAAVMAVWGHGTMYYLLTSRSAARSATGAVALLVWETIRLANRLGLQYDFDGYAKPSAVPFLAGFGGRVANRVVLRRASRLARLALAWRGD